MSFKNEKWDELERLKEKFLTLDKQQIVPSRNREKIRILEKILQLEPDEQYALARKGEILYDMSECDASVECFEQVLLINPENMRAMYGKAENLICLGELEEAVECYDKISRRHEPPDELWLDRGWVLELLGRHQDAIKDYDFFMSLDPENQNDFSVLERKIECLKLLGRKKEVKEFQKVVYGEVPESSKLFKKTIYYLGMFGFSFGITYVANYLTRIFL